MNNGSRPLSMSDTPLREENPSSPAGAVRSVMRRVVRAMTGLTPLTSGSARRSRRGFAARAMAGASDSRTLDKHQVQAIFAAAEFAAETAVIQQFGYFDEFDPRLGAAYDKVFYALIAERCPDHKLDALVTLLNS